MNPSLLSDETYAERFVAFADLEDGTYVQIQLGVSNIGAGDGKGVCNLLLVEPNGRVTDEAEVVDRKQWRYEGGRLTIGPCHGTLDNEHFELFAKVKGREARLTLLGNAATEQFPAHSARAGDDFYTLDVLLPNARAELHLRTPDGKESTLRGFGFADHPRSKITPKKLAKAWIRFRALHEHDTALVLVRVPTEGPPVGWLKFPEQGQTVNVTRVGLRHGPASEKSAPAWRIALEGEGRSWRISSGHPLLRSAPMEERGFFGSMVGSAVGNPVTYTYRAVLQDSATGAESSGLLEVTLTDE